jgi:CRP/FNR family cyclic AMP-dependent transcriptional regulator
VENVLPKVSFLGGLNETALSLLARAAHRMEVPPGTVIVREGEPGNQMYLIESGMVRICKNCGQPDETELAQLSAGAFFGEMCILETLPRSATAQAGGETVLYRLSSLTFYQLYRTMPDQFGLLILNLARDLSRRVRRLDEVFAARH